MLIAFFVNAMEDEYQGYTTTLLAYEASRRGHDVCYITPEDFVFGVDDRMRAHARFVPAGKQPRRRSLAKFFKDLQSVANTTTLVEITDIDVLMLRNDPSNDAIDRPWAAAPPARACWCSTIRARCRRLPTSCISSPFPARCARRR